MDIYNHGVIKKIDTDGIILCKIPNPAFLENIKTLVEILELIFRDWVIAQQPFEEEIKGKPKEIVEQIFLYHYFQIQSQYLKCLFSYVMMFWSLKLVYDHVYASFNAFNKETNLMTSHSKPPKVDPFIQKVKNIRDLSIAHIGSKEVNALDSLAAYHWKPLSASFEMNAPFSLENIEFGSGAFRITGPDGKIKTSLDLQVMGLRDMHNKCQGFIEKYDQTCVDYLMKLKAILPLKVNDILFAT